MNDKLHVLVTYALEDVHLDAIRSVDPARIEIEVLGQDQRRLLRGAKYPSERERESVAEGLHGAFSRAEVAFGFWGAELSEALSRTAHNGPGERLSLRAVADDHQAAQSIGIPLKRIWVIVWSVAGFVALVAGIIWGSKLGVQFSLSLVALKALPVVILGGLTSIPGAIVGGLLIGVGEKLSEVYLGPFVGGGIEIWFAYVLALLFLLVRPQGLFGERIIERV